MLVAVSASTVRRLPSASSLRRPSITSGRVTSSFVRSSTDWRGSVGDLLAIVGRLEAKRVSLPRPQPCPARQSLDTGTATGRLMLAVIGAVGQAEREGMLERQREGIPEGQARRPVQGPRADRAPAGSPRSAGLRQAGVSPSEIAVRLGIVRASVYRVLG